MQYHIYIRPTKLFFLEVIQKPKKSWDNGDFPVLSSVFFMMHFWYYSDNKFHGKLSSDLFINQYAVTWSYVIKISQHMYLLSLHLHQLDNLKYIISI